MPDDPDAISTAKAGVDLTAMIGAQLDALLGDGAGSLEGRRLGPYRVVEVLGRGGMGVVYLAERDDDHFHKRVAIKVVSGIGLGPDALTRFLSEREILARLEHPYIAHLIDGGQTPQEQPFLVMEYVEGEPLMEACRSRQLGLNARIELFLKICEAVQFAHQNLIVHRDLKPGNILVTADGFPKLLDFGIAKVLDPRQFEQTMVETRDGQMLLTPQHAAPEQVLGRPITTATDVYCLGVLLFELLTGQRPYRLASARPGELERIICEQPAPAPSSVLERTGAADPDGQASRPLPVDRLRRRLRGDLDNIVLKALRKEPERRYRSVSELAEDLQRYRRGMTVSARPDTWFYRTGKFVRRNWIGVAAVVSLLTLTTVFAIVTGVQNRRIDRERQIAVEVSSFLTGLFRNYDPYESPDANIKVVRLLDRAAERIDDELAGHNAVRAKLMSTLGVVYKHVGAFDKAESLLGMALRDARTAGLDETDVMATHNELGEVLVELARYDAARSAFETARSLAQRLRLGDDHELARALLGLGNVAMETRDYDRAERHFIDALAMDRRVLGANDPRLADTITGLGTYYWRRNALDDAGGLYREALALRERVLGPNHPETIEALNNLAAVLTKAGNFDGAERYLREALERNERVLGPAHPTVAINLNNVGYVLLMTGRFDEAVPLYTRALAIERDELGAAHPDLAYGLNNLAEVLMRSGRLDEAEPYFEEALAVLETDDGYEHRLTGQVMANYALLLAATGRADAAHRFALDARGKIEAEYAEGHWRRGFADLAVGRALLARGAARDALPDLERAAAVFAAAGTPPSVHVADVRDALATARAALAVQR